MVQSYRFRTVRAEGNAMIHAAGPAPDVIGCVSAGPGIDNERDGPLNYLGSTTLFRRSQQAAAHSASVAASALKPQQGANEAEANVATMLSSSRSSFKMTRRDSCVVMRLTETWTEKALTGPSHGPEG
jgi:hypothetical protein